MNVPFFFFDAGSLCSLVWPLSFQPFCISLVNADVIGVFCQVQLNMILKQVRDNTSQCGRGEFEGERDGSIGAQKTVFKSTAAWHEYGILVEFKLKDIERS